MDIFFLPKMSTSGYCSTPSRGVSEMTEQRLGEHNNTEQKARGFFGVGIYHGKTESNLGTLWRSAHNFGASFIFTIGNRYAKQHSDTTKAWRSIPLFHYVSFDEFIESCPKDCQIIAIEQTQSSLSLKTFVHPERAIYLMGAEDHGIPETLLVRCFQIVHIDTPMCINVSVAGSIVMYDRSIKS